MISTSIEKCKIIFFGTQEKKTIVKNTIWLSVAEMITRLSKFALIVYATRILGPTGFGQFSFALALVTLFAVIFDFGLSQVTSREIVQNRKSENDFASIISLKLLLSFLTLAAIYIYSQLTISDPIINQAVLILSIFMVSSGIGELYYSYFQAKKKMEYEAWSKIIQAIIVTLVGFALVTSLRSVTGLSISYALASVPSLVYIFLLYQRKKSTSDNPSRSFQIWKKYLLMSWPLMLTGIFAMIYNDIDSIIMGYYGQIHQVGLYNAAYRITGIALIPAWLIYKSFSPAINESFLKSKDSFKRIWRYYSKVNLLMIPPILLTGVVFAPQIMNLVFGPEYNGAILAFQILIGVTCIVILSYPYTQVLIASHMQKKIFWSTFWGAVINLLLNFLLIPKYSLNGAALATLLALFTVLMIQYYYARRAIHESF